MASATTKTIYRFGTSGYRHDQDEAFNDAVIRQITQAISDYLVLQIEESGQLLPVLIGGDTREKSRRYIPVIAELLKSNGLDVFQASTDVPSPVLAYAAKYFTALGFDDLPYTETLGAILMTASHNPWPYGGYNFLTPDGAVMPTPVSKQFEAYQAEPANRKLDRAKLGVKSPAEIRLFDPYEPYRQHLKETMGIDYSTIKASGVKVFYDPLYATGRNYLPRLLKDEGISSTVIHDTDERPAGYTGMPEPTGDNLPELKALIKADSSSLKVGLANDGDSDRFGVLDENGEFVNANDVLALILHLLLTYRGKTGVILRSQATTHLLDALAKQSGLEVVQTPVGYKYIAEEFVERAAGTHGQPVLLGGESSGGVSVIGHLPEKDGLLANLLVTELVAREARPLSQVLAHIRAMVPQRYVFRELGVHTERKDDILAYFRKLQAEGGTLAGYTVDSGRSVAGSDKLERAYGTRDGVKLLLKNDESWVLVRTSGTEPLARIYVEGVADTADTAQAKSQELLDVITTILTKDYAVPASQIKERR